MIITIKNLKQVKYDVELTPEVKYISDLKKIVEKLSGILYINIKLIFQGKILENNLKIQELKLVNGSEMILMNTKVNLTRKSLKHNENDIKNNEEFRKNVEYVMLMGYKEEDAESALIKCNNDFISAVDELEKNEDNFYSDFEDSDVSDDEESETKVFEISGEELLNIAAILIKIESNCDKSKFEENFISLVNDHPNIGDFLLQNLDKVKKRFCREITADDWKIHEEYSKNYKFNVSEIERKTEDETEGEYDEINENYNTISDKTSENSIVILNIYSGINFSLTPEETKNESEYTMKKRNRSDN